MEEAPAVSSTLANSEVSRMKKSESDGMWRTLKVELEFSEGEDRTGRLCGSVPLSKELIRPWLEARKASDSRYRRLKKEEADNGEQVQTIEELEEELDKTVEDVQERTTVGFEKDDKGLFLHFRSIRGHIKDCANQVREFVGIPAFKSKVANCVHVVEPRIYLGRLETDGEYEQPVHVFSPAGPRNALKCIRFVKDVNLSFHLRIFNGGAVTDESLRKIFEYGSVHGLGGERSMGEGRYLLKTFEEVVDGDEK